ncbi:MAG: phytoene/squalene synthase family protein [Bacteroidetes bacterium]|nr:phytoene/squalene synthase family protein [Bacteroidota bacterium]
MKALYDQLSLKNSRAVTQMYSTSFSSGVAMLGKDLRDPIHAIYGFVRLADEIVDSFHEYNQPELLRQFRVDTEYALQNCISLNPILNSFQWAVHKYSIKREHIDAFLYSMEMDLEKVLYNREKYETYIYGSAQVVGLMCLHVFCEGKDELYEELKSYAMSLGSAFQKVNFLRDIKADVEHLGRLYFPNVHFDRFSDSMKEEIEKEIEEEFAHALIGIKKLPNSSKLGVFAAYNYYRGLLKRITQVPASELFKKRIRVPNLNKVSLMIGSRTLVGIGQV